jgi:Fe-S-cluster containining protein
MTVPDKGGELCLRCGLCCDGTLFSHVPLEPEEVERVRDLGLDVDLPEKGEASFRQCCSALSGTRCTIYEHRPDACKRYRCHLLMALEEDEVSLEDALSVVGQARQMLSQLDEALDDAGDDAGGGSVTQRARLAHRPAHGSPLAPETRRLMLDIGVFLNQYFKSRFGN